MLNKKLIIAGLIIVGGLIIGGSRYYQTQRFDAEAILAQSVLKDKKFTAKVQQLEVDGMRAYFLEEHSNPIVAVSFVFMNAGSAHEAENKQGLTAVLENMLLNGAGKYNAVEFRNISEEYGIHIGFSASVDTFAGSLQMPSANADKAAELLTDVLYRPRFDDEYLNLTKQQLLYALKVSEERIGSVLSNAYAAEIFKNHPYSRPLIGTPETVDKIAKDDLLRYMHRYFTQKNLIIGIAGDLTPQAAEKLIGKIFGGLTKEFVDDELPDFSLKTTGKQYNVEKFFAQAMTRFAVLGTTRQSEDFYPLYIANYVFGGSGLNSRISQIIREKNGLTYGIYTYLAFHDKAAVLTGSYSATPENFEKARNLLLAEWQKMEQSGITQSELQQAKNAMIASHNLRFASIDGISDMLVAMQQYDLGADFLEKRNDYVRAVTLEQVNAAARKYFKNKPDFVSVGLKNIDEGEKK